MVEQPSRFVKKFCSFVCDVRDIMEKIGRPQIYGTNGAEEELVVFDWTGNRQLLLFLSQGAIEFISVVIEVTSRQVPPLFTTW